MTEKTPLTDQTIKRLRGLANGNGLAPETIELVRTDETIHTVLGQVQLTPSFQIQTTIHIGKIKEKNKRLLPSVAALQEEVRRIQDDFKKKASWVKNARQEIEKTSGHGWGLETATITWPGQETTLAATENCPICKGMGQSTCPHCFGQGYTTCIHCQGRGEEYCPHCQGTGQDPADPSQKCSLCHGKCFTPCRFCQATGKEICPHCQGKGNLPCPACNGTGYITQEVKINCGAEAKFSLGRTADLPSGLLRLMQRIGEDRLTKGHVDVKMEPPLKEPESDGEQTALLLTAKIPYAEMVLKIGEEKCKVFAFGKKGHLSNVPLFLDKSLASARKALLRAAKGLAPLDKATTSRRLMLEALFLVLKGETNPNALRRLYPIGLSGKTAQEIMRNLSLALKNNTRKTRAMTGGGLVLFNAALFMGLFVLFPQMPIAQEMNAQILRVIQHAIPLASLALSWLTLLHSARWALKSKYPKATVTTTQSIGKVGYGALALIVLLYVLISRL